MPDIVTFPFEVTGELLQDGVNGLHNVTTAQKFALGARYHKKVGPMDCVYRYGKSNAACYAGRGVAFWNNMAAGIDYASLSGTQVIGDLSVTFDAATHPAYVEDELYGGSILISDDEAGGATDADPQNRTIAGNLASAENAACTVFLDTPLSRATSTTTNAFLMPNPYSALRTDLTGGRVQHAMAGVPAAYVSAADRYFWVQTWGPVWVAMQSDLSSKTYEQMEAMWRWDGSICLASNAAPGTHEYAQCAGFVIDRGNSASFIMLQISP